MSLPDPSTRFTDRVEHYVRHRPSYPPALLDYLRSESFLREGITVADVGSGTGISALPFVRAGCRVFAVEPNRPMRVAAESLMAGNEAFSSVAGSAEATTLPDQSVDLVIAGQAFHWFDRDAARREFDRILRPGGGVALFWNSRDLTGSPFAVGYESLLQTFGTDYSRVRHDAIGQEQIGRFFAPATFRTASFPFAQQFDYAGLEGRLLSSSYVPAAGHPTHQPMLLALRRLFDACQSGGTVTMHYRTEIYVGRL